MNQNGQAPDVLNVQGRMTYGYGIIPKMAMQDIRLTPEAKAIYAYFCSYAGAGTTAFPSRDKILRDLQIGLKRYYRHFSMLKQYGYINVKQIVDSTGTFKNNVYTLVEMIPCVKNSRTEPYGQNDHTVPCSRFDHTEPCGRFAYTRNDHTKNNNTKITIKNQGLKNNKEENLKINTKGQGQSQGQSQDQNQPPKEKPDMTPTPDIDRGTAAPVKANIKSQEQEQRQEQNPKEKTAMTHASDAPVPMATKTSAEPDKKNGFSANLPIPNYRQAENPKTTSAKHTVDDYNRYRNLIQHNICYSSLIQSSGKSAIIDARLVNGFVDVMLDVILTESPSTVKIGKEIKSREIVKSVYLKLGYDHMQLILEKYREQYRQITHKTAYMRTMLYNSFLEIDAHFENAVRVDGVVR